jgi:hypothetical protein
LFLFIIAAVAVNALGGTSMAVADSHGGYMTRLPQYMQAACVGMFWCHLFCAVDLPGKLVADAEEDQVGGQIY